MKLDRAYPLDDPDLLDEDEEESAPAPRGRMSDAVLLVIVLWYAWIAGYEEAPVAVQMLWIPLLVAGLLLQKRRLLVPRSPLFLCALAMGCVPVIKNGMVGDWTGALEASMVLAGFAAAPMAGAYIRSMRVIPAILLLFVLPLCICGWVMNGSDLSTLLGGFVLQRGGLRPPDGTHHFMGSISAMLICLAWRRIPWKYLAVLGIFLILSGARSYWASVPAAIAIGELMRLPKLRPHYLVFGAIFGLLISTAVLMEPYIGEFVNSSSWGNYISLGGQDEVDKYGALSGRTNLWNYYLTLFYQSKKVGWSTDYIRPQRVWDGNREVSQGADGEILNAASESQFDYYLARDGMWGFAAIGMYAFLAAAFQKDRNTNSVILLIFAAVAAFGNPIARATYSPIFVVFAAGLWALAAPPEEDDDEEDWDDVPEEEAAH